MQRRALWLMWAGCAGLAACSGAHEPARDAAAVTDGPARPAAVLDVPALLGLSVDALGQRLGPLRPPPADFIDPVNAPLLLRGEAIDSTALFRYRGLVLVAAYNPGSRRVRDLLLLGPDEDLLMQRALLVAGNRRYLLLPVFEQRRPTALLGLRVVPME